LRSIFSVNSWRVNRFFGFWRFRFGFWRFRFDSFAAAASCLDRAFAAASSSRSSSSRRHRSFASAEPGIDCTSSAARSSATASPGSADAIFAKYFCAWVRIWSAVRVGWNLAIPDAPRP